MKISEYVNHKSASMGLSRVINFVKEEKNHTTVTVDSWTAYKLEKGDDALTRRETRFYRFKGKDYSHACEAAMVFAAMDYFGWTEERLQAELDAVEEAYKKKEPVEKPVETVEKAETVVVKEVKSVPPTPEESKPVVKKKKKKASKKVEVKKEEPKKEEPAIVLPEEEDEFADLGGLDIVEPVVELFPFVKSNKAHVAALSKLLVKNLGSDWKKNPDFKAKVVRAIKEMEQTPLFDAMGEPSKDFVSEVSKFLV